MINHLTGPAGVCDKDEPWTRDVSQVITKCCEQTAVTISRYKIKVTEQYNSILQQCHSAVNKSQSAVESIVNTNFNELRSAINEPANKLLSNLSMHLGEGEVILGCAISAINSRLGNMEGSSNAGIIQETTSGMDTVDGGNLSTDIGGDWTNSDYSGASDGTGGSSPFSLTEFNNSISQAVVGTIATAQDYIGSSSVVDSGFAVTCIGGLCDDRLFDGKEGWRTGDNEFGKRLQTYFTDDGIRKAGQLVWVPVSGGSGGGDNGGDNPGDDGLGGPPVLPPGTIPPVTTDNGLSIECKLDDIRTGVDDILNSANLADDRSIQAGQLKMMGMIAKSIACLCECGDDPIRPENFTYSLLASRRNSSRQAIEDWFYNWTQSVKSFDNHDDYVDSVLREQGN